MKQNSEISRVSFPKAHSKVSPQHPLLHSPNLGGHKSLHFRPCCSHPDTEPHHLSPGALTGLPMFFLHLSSTLPILSLHSNQLPSWNVILVPLSSFLNNKINSYLFLFAGHTNGSFVCMSLCACTHPPDNVPYIWIHGLYRQGTSSLVTHWHVSYLLVHVLLSLE